MPRTIKILSLIILSLALFSGGCKKQTSESKGLLPPPPLKASGKGAPPPAGSGGSASKAPGTGSKQVAAGGQNAPGKAAAGGQNAPGKAAAGGQNAPGKAGGKGAAASSGKGTPSPPPTAPRWKCGNGTCEVLKGEDCIVCADDCGKCDGCQKKADPLCPGCKCENCVCAKVASCCAKNGAWGAACVAACKDKCGGCGIQ
jgi:hypothetical protein